VRKPLYDAKSGELLRDLLCNGQLFVPARYRRTLTLLDQT
jgi:hypothetical protein